MHITLQLLIGTSVSYCSLTMSYNFYLKYRNTTYLCMEMGNQANLLLMLEFNTLFLLISCL